MRTSGKESVERGGEGRYGGGSSGNGETGKSRSGDACQRAWERNNKKKNRKFCFSLLFCTWLSSLPRVNGYKGRREAAVKAGWAPLTPLPLLALS